MEIFAPILLGQIFAHPPDERKLWALVMLCTLGPNWGLRFLRQMSFVNSNLSVTAIGATGSLNNKGRIRTPSSECDFNNKCRGPNQVLRRGNSYGACKFEVLLSRQTQLTTEVKIKIFTKAIFDSGQEKKRKEKKKHSCRPLCSMAFWMQEFHTNSLQ